MHEATAFSEVSPIGGSGSGPAAGAGLERCPSCDYDLSGAPPEHRCPECGLAYDEHSRVWRPRRPFWFIRGTIVFGIVGPIVVFHARGDPLSASLLSGLDLSGLEWTLFAAWFLLVLAVLLWMRSVYRHRYLVATLPDGLLVRSFRCKLIPWSDITSVQVTLPEVRIFRARGRCVGLPQLFKDLVEKEAFATEVSAARNRAGAPPLGQPPKWCARRLYYAAMRW